MSRPPRSSTPTAVHAANLAELLVSTDPEAAEKLAANAARHFERARHLAGRPPVRVGEAFPNVGAASGPHTPGPAVRALREKAGQEGARNYLHRGPTRSPVMNAFLHAYGDPGVIAGMVSIPDEHRLAPRLVELARRYWPKMLLAAGDVPAMLAIAEKTAPIENEEAARFLMRRAAGPRGTLAAIARDYEAHRRERGREAPDDRPGQCMMAAFAGQMIGYAARLLGHHVREDLRAALERLCVAASGAPVRQRAARVLEAPPAVTPQRDRRAR